MKQANSKIIKYIAGSALLLFVSCENPNTEALTYPDKTFIPANWKKDSTGCFHYRQNTYEGIVKNKSFFRGKSATYLINLLGRPTFLTNDSKNKTLRAIHYVVACTEIPVLQADKKDIKPVYSNFNTTTLVFDFSKETCRNVRVAIP